LIVVDSNQANDLVPRISRYANTQNKVSDSDFFSNHPFHVRMEEKSLLIRTPRLAGQHFETKWFYERTRGQYLNERNKRSSRDRKTFEAEFPKAQMLTKTDAAKYIVSWAQEPFVVSSGAQKNFLAFAKQVSEQWEKSELLFDDRYFRGLVAKAILFRSLESAVSQADWYKANTGYRANIVTYTIARFSLAASSVGDGKEFDLESIWNLQRVPDDLMEEVLGLAESVREVLVDPSRPVENVTEWAKRPQCWDAVSQLPFDFPIELNHYLASASEVAERRRSGRSAQRLDNGIVAQTKVIDLGETYWRDLKKFALRTRALSDDDLSLLDVAALEGGRVPSERQAKKILAIRARIVELGFRER
jgi:hypothetical protein